ncbi:MAG: phage major tail tube protein [Betaproteobacteria bacterium]|nr:phage major tail tube protein [Betaproteobacteria bacterium]
MALAKVLKFFTVHVDGQGGVGEYEEIKLPDIEMEMKDYIGGGMISPVKIDMGLKALETELTGGGWLPDVLATMGQRTLDGVPIMFLGSVQNDASGAIDAVEIHMRGRIEKAERDNAKQGDIGKQKFKFTLAYYKEIWNGAVKVELDPLNFICIIGGQDVYAEHKKNIGLG